MKTKIEIINETVKFYSEDTSRRAFTSDWGFNEEQKGVCCYLTEDGRQCAVGRCLENSADIANGGIATVWNTAKFKPEYEGHDKTFWSDLQNFHDPHIYWNDSSGLTKPGQVHLQKLLEKYEGQ